MKNGQWIFFAVLVSLVSCRESSHSSRDLADPTVYADTVFSQEYHEAYALNNGSDNNVRSIAIDHDDNVWIATKNGVLRKNNPGLCTSALTFDLALGTTNSFSAQFLNIVSGI